MDKETRDVSTSMPSSAVNNSTKMREMHNSYGDVMYER